MQTLKEALFAGPIEAVVTIEKNPSDSCKHEHITTKNLLLMLSDSEARSFDKGLWKNRASLVFAVRVQCCASQKLKAPLHRLLFLPHGLGKIKM